MAMMRTKHMNVAVQPQQQDEWGQGHRIMPDTGINSRYTDQASQ